jgi:aryl-alcohol dehydrogenase-like predicted oxidoreductase
MQKNILGKTGLEVSAIGIGGHEYRWLHAGNIKDSRHIHFNPERQKLVAMAINNGVNYFDTTYQEEVQSLGHVLKNLGKNESLIINGMIIDVVKQVMGLSKHERETFIQRELDLRLEFLGRDYFDIFMLCNLELNYDPDLIQEVISIYQKHQQAGKFRFIGISGHSYSHFLEFLNLEPEIDVVMFNYNYARVHENGNQLAELLAVIEEKRLGFVAIKPLVWSIYGVPFTAINAEWYDIQELIQQAISWQVNQGRAHTSIIGVETVEELSSILHGTNIPCDESMLAPYLTNQGNLGVLVRNGLKHSKEIQWRIIEYFKNQLGINHGDELKSYMIEFDSK